MTETETSKLVAFLNRIEGSGYGGMADFEIARTIARELTADNERLTREHKQAVACFVAGEIMTRNVELENGELKARVTALEAECARMNKALKYVIAEATSGIAYEAMLNYKKPEDRANPDGVIPGLRTSGHIKMSMIRDEARAALNPEGK